MDKLMYEEPEMQVIHVSTESRILNGSQTPGGSEGVGGGVDD